MSFPELQFPGLWALWVYAVFHRNDLAAQDPSSRLSLKDRSCTVPSVLNSSGDGASSRRPDDSRSQPGAPALLGGSHDLTQPWLISVPFGCGFGPTSVWTRVLQRVTGSGQWCQASVALALCTRRPAWCSLCLSWLALRRLCRAGAHHGAAAAPCAGPSRGAWRWMKWRGPAALLSYGCSRSCPAYGHF